MQNTSVFSLSGVPAGKGWMWSQSQRVTVYRGTTLYWVRYTYKSNFPVGFRCAELILPTKPLCITKCAVYLLCIIICAVFLLFLHNVEPWRFLFTCLLYKKIPHGTAEIYVAQIFEIFTKRHETIFWYFVSPTCEKQGDGEEAKNLLVDK